MKSNLIPDKIFMSRQMMDSVYPPETFFGFSYWSLMVPPIKPNNVLILGYGNGTISGLIRKIWGNDLKITGIDIKTPEIKYDKDDVLIMDAYKFLDEFACKYDKFDYVVVDLYGENGISPIVYDGSFVDKLFDVCSLRISLNVHQKDINKFLNDNGKSKYEELFNIELIKNMNDQSVVFFKKKELLNE